MSHADTQDAVLVVDDNTAIHQVLQGALEQDRTRRVVGVKSAREAREQLLASPFDVVITDISMPDEDGLSLMRWAAEHCPDPAWIVLTGHGTLDAAIQALQLGAFDFFTKPLESLAALDHSVSNAIERRRLVRERDRLHRQLECANEELTEKIDQLEDACRLLGEQAETIHADLRRASVIQRALLPRHAPELGEFGDRGR
jgi:DNA-binding NtrC family response regulator